jgi:hypothetical protein
LLCTELISASGRQGGGDPALVRAPDVVVGGTTTPPGVSAPFSQIQSVDIELSMFPGNEPLYSRSLPALFTDAAGAGSESSLQGMRVVGIVSRPSVALSSVRIFLTCLCRRGDLARERMLFAVKLPVVRPGLRLRFVCVPAADSKDQGELQALSDNRLASAKETGSFLQARLALVLKFAGGVGVFASPQ